jgi:hypothetical protein
MTAAESADHGHDKAIQIVINGRKRTVEAKEAMPSPTATARDPLAARPVSQRSGLRP